MADDDRPLDADVIMKATTSAASCAASYPAAGRGASPCPRRVSA
jgi:hypothetical protein